MCPNGVGSRKVEVGEIDTKKPFPSVKDAIIFFSCETKTINNTKPNFAERAVALTTRGESGGSGSSSATEFASERPVSHQLVPDQVPNVQQNKTPNQLSSASSLANDGGVLKVRTSTLQVNQFPVSFNPDTIIKRHEVDVKPEVDPKNGRQQIKKLDLMKIRDKFFGGNSSEYKTGRDGEKNIVGAVSLPTRTFKVDLDEGGDPINNTKMVKMQAQEEAEEGKRAVDDLVRKVRTANEAKASEAVQALKDANCLRIEEQTSKVKAEEVAQSILQVGVRQKHAKSFVEENLKRQSDPKLAQNVDSVSDIISVVKAAKESLKIAAEEEKRSAKEETSVWNLVESLKLELVALKKENSELKEKAVESETIRGNLLVKLRKSANELQAARSRDSKARRNSMNMKSTIQQLKMEAELAGRKTEEMRQIAEGSKKEAAAFKRALVEAENKVRASILVVETAARFLEESEKSSEQNKVMEAENASRILTQTKKSSGAYADHWIRKSWKAVTRPVLKKLICVCRQPGL